jgi:tRNA pseudouridine38-40 synthase
MLRNIKLTIAYDGSDFSGWQRQTSDRSVQAVVEDALGKINKCRTVLAAAGRTDAGVHAAGQAANFYTPVESIKPENFVPALNRLLPPDVRIVKAEAAAPDFHARFDAVLRRYRYFMVCGRQAPPYERRYAAQLWHSPNLGVLNDYARLLRGELDCSLFASARDSTLRQGGGSTCRFIRQAYFFAAGEKLVFEISANAFLWKMVRSIVGSLLLYEEQGLSVEDFRALLRNGDHGKAGPTAPPHGLFLWNVEYRQRAGT